MNIFIILLNIKYININLGIYGYGELIVGTAFREEEWRAIKDVARGLQYFAHTKNYTYIDRIADAFSPEVAIAALRDALRVLRSEASRDRTVYVPRTASIERVVRLLSEHRGVGDVLAALALSAWPRREESGAKGEG